MSQEEFDGHSESLGFKVYTLGTVQLTCDE